jgi:hypothetical protein
VISRGCLPFQLLSDAKKANSAKYVRSLKTRDFVGRCSFDGAGGQTCTILPQAMFFVDLAA